MKIILVNWVSNWGSTGYILRDIKNGLSALGHEVYAVSGISKNPENDDSIILSKGWHLSIYARLIKLGRAKFSGDPISTIKLIRLIEKIKPDVVHLHLLHCATFDLYKLLKWLGQNNIKTVITHHAELYYTANCGYAFNCTKWIENQCANCEIPVLATGSRIFANPHRNYLKLLKALSYFNYSNLIHTTVSPWVKSRFLLSGFSKGFDCEVVLNGIDTSTFTVNTNYQPSCAIPSKYAIYVSAVFDGMNKDDIKGGWYLTECARLLPNVNFLVVATVVKNADSLPPNILVWGKAKNQDELAFLYANAKVTVLTSKRETFSMICAESLSCGTPVVGFYAGGPESISIPMYSQFTDYGDIGHLCALIKNFMDKDFDSNTISQTAGQKYSKAAMSLGYEAVYKKIINKH